MTSTRDHIIQARVLTGGTIWRPPAPHRPVAGNAPVGGKSSEFAMRFSLRAAVVDFGASGWLGRRLGDSVKVWRRWMWVGWGRVCYFFSSQRQLL